MKKPMITLAAISALLGLDLLGAVAEGRATIDACSGGKSPRERASKTSAPNGERECARRRRQIASGMLKVSA